MIPLSLALIGILGVQNPAKCIRFVTTGTGGEVRLQSLTASDGRVTNSWSTKVLPEDSRLIHASMSSESDRLAILYQRNGQAFVQLVSASKGKSTGLPVRVADDAARIAYSRGRLIVLTRDWPELFSPENTPKSSNEENLDGMFRSSMDYSLTVDGVLYIAGLEGHLDTSSGYLHAFDVKSEKFRSLHYQAERYAFDGPTSVATTKEYLALITSGGTVDSYSVRRPASPTLLRSERSRFRWNRVWPGTAVDRFYAASDSAFYFLTMSKAGVLSPISAALPITDSIQHSFAECPGLVALFDDAGFVSLYRFKGKARPKFDGKKRVSSCMCWPVSITG